MFSFSNFITVVQLMVVTNALRYNISECVFLILSCRQTKTLTTPGKTNDRYDFRRLSSYLHYVYLLAQL